MELGFSENNQAWYSAWFNTPFYHLLYQHRDYREAEDFIDNLFDRIQPDETWHILDLACGRGRHAAYMHQLGMEVTGLDLSENNIQFAAQLVSNRLHFKVADMRENYGEKKFDLVLNLFTSFAYFEDWQDNFQALQQIHRSLKDDGLFVLDFLNISSLPRDLDRIEKTEIEGYSFHVRRYFEDAKLEKDISVKAPDGQDYSFKESIWALSLMDLQAMFKEVGFEILDTYGSYKLTNFEALESDRLILLARKA